MAITGTPTTVGDDVVTITPTGAYVVDGQSGTDTLVLNFATLGSDIRYEYIGGGWYRFTDDVHTRADFLGFEKYYLTGGEGDDTLVGGDLADSMVGGLGNDRFESGLGADTVVGGAGQDRWVANYSAFASAVTLNLSLAGTATVGGSSARISGIDAISLTTGAAADNIKTDNFIGNDVVSTGAGNDTISLGRGVDTLDGGADTDTMRMDWSAVTDANAGISRSYQGGGWYRYTNGMDRIDYLNIEKFNLLGGAGSDVLYGAGLGDTLTGNGGNDYLAGGAGNDQISGGDGVDTWQTDTSARGSLTIVDLTTQTTNFGSSFSGIEQIDYTGGNAADRVTALAGVYNDRFATGENNDTITTGRGVDWVNAGGGANDRLVMDWSTITDARHGISNSYIGGDWWRYASGSGDQTDYYGIDTFDLRGGAGDDMLIGGALNDTLIGNGGDDTLNSGFGDAVIEGGAGNDLWVANLSTQGAANFDAVFSRTAAQVTGLGLSVSGIERLSLVTGNSDDLISTQGYALNDNITTSDGADTINAGLGFDTIEAGLGIDVMVLNYATATSAVYNSYIGGGWNRYQMADGTARVDWYNLERFNLTGGSGHDSLSGGAYNDTLLGNAGNDVLNGGAGVDSVVGGQGSDTYIGNYSTAAVAISMNLTAAGAATLNGIGTRLTGIESINLTTGAGNDVINLGAASGDDTVYSGAGDDVITFGRGHFEVCEAGLGEDTAVFDGGLSTSGLRQWYYGGGWTRIQSTDGSYTADFYSVEHLNIQGSARSDHVYGFGNSDTLSGNAGVDFLDGAGGNDVLTGGAGPDLFVFTDLWNAGRDLITDGSSGDLLRISGYNLVGVATGNGGTAMQGEVYVDDNGVTSTLHIGLDNSAGADLHIDLTGVYGAGSFTIAGTDILFI